MYVYEFYPLQIQEVGESKGKGRNEPVKRLLQRWDQFTVRLGAAAVAEAVIV